jgi:hypothetical protein
MTPALGGVLAGNTRLLGQLLIPVSVNDKE